MLNSVSFGSQQNQGGSFLGILKDSAINVGATVGTGAAIGALGGKAFSLLPYTPNQSAIQFQYADMFEKATALKETPKYLQEGVKGAEAVLKQGKSLKRSVNFLSEHHLVSSALIKGLEQEAGEEISNPTLKEEVLKFFNGIKTPIKEGEFNKTEALSKLKNLQSAYEKAYANKLQKYSSLQNSFVEHLENIKNTDIQELATKAAKDLRKNAVVGIGIAAGIIGALVLNILHTNGLIGKNKSAKANAPSIGTNQG